MKDVFRELTMQMIDFIWTNAPIAAIAVPILTIAAVMRFLRWSTNTARGETYQELSGDLEQSRTGLSSQQLTDRYAAARERRRYRS